MRQRIVELQREWNDARARHPRIAYGVAAVALLVALLPAVAGAFFLLRLPGGLPDDAALSRIGDMDQATAVFDASDQLAFTVFKEQRIEVPLAEMSNRMVDAVLAIEDQRFYDHHGFDVRRMASAALANLRRRRAAQGAS